MPKYHGRGGLMYMSTSGTGPLNMVVQMNEWSLNLNTDKAETTSFEDANKTYVQGHRDTQGSLAGFWNSDSDDLFTASDSPSGVQLLLYPARAAMSKYFRGPAWVDLAVAVSVADSVKATGNFVANGSWTRNS